METAGRLDLRGTPCPMNFVKTKLALEELEPGEVLEIILDSGDPMRNVPRSVKEEGHRVVQVEPVDDGAAFSLMIRRGEE